MLPRALPKPSMSEKSLPKALPPGAGAALALPSPAGANQTGALPVTVADVGMQDIKRMAASWRSGQAYLPGRKLLPSVLVL